MPNKKGTKELNELIKKAIKEKGLNKEEIKKYFEKSFGSSSANGHLSDFLAGKKTAEISFLIGVYAALQGKTFPDGLKATELQKSYVKTNPDELKKWLVYWLEGILEQDMGRKRTHGNPLIYEESYLNKWFEAIEELKANNSEVKTFSSDLPTLDYFPDAFTPLTVITGTGLAIPPETISDLFRDNARLTDLFFLNQLNLPKDTRIVSDRLVLDMSPQERIKHFGNTHLLLIGGPKVNGITRKFCKYGFFRFEFQSKAEAFENFYDELNNKEVQSELFPNSNCIKMLYELLANPKRDVKDFKELVNDEIDRIRITEKVNEIKCRLGSPETFKYENIVKLFLPERLVDPYANSFYSIRPLSSSHDHTLITIAPNFYNGKNSFDTYDYQYVSVIIAGIDRLGTASGVKKLIQPENFSSHPVGGFLEATWGTSMIDFEKYDKSSCSWTSDLTPNYTIKEFIEKVENFKDTKHGKDNSPLQKMKDEKGLENYLKFLRKFQIKE